MRPGVHVQFGYFIEGHAGPGWYSWDEDHTEEGSAHWDHAPSLAELADRHGADLVPLQARERTAS